MEILEMITEWRKGCSLSGKNPIECPACTEALIDAIERHEKDRLKLSKNQEEEHRVC